MTKKLHIKKDNYSITLMDEEDIQDKLDEKADTTDLTELAGQIDDIVAGDLDLTTYAKKSDLRTDEIADENTYSNIANVEQTQESINAAIDDKLGALSNVDLVKVVGTRPTASADTMNKLYLVAESSNITEDNYEIFITVRSGSANNYSYTWEKVDTARVNLSNYIQKSSTVGLVKNDGSIDTQTKVNVAQGSGNASKNVVTDSSGNITTEAKPTIPTKTSQLTNDSNYTTATGHNHDGTYIKTGTGTVTSTNIANNTIVNEDIASNAAIAYSKLSGVVSSTDTRLTNKRNPINNEIAANSNLNNFINAGFYYCQGDAEVAPTIVNQPLTSGNQRSFSMIVELISSTRVVQKLTYYFTKDTYIRTNINGTWSTWNCVLHSGNYSNYANKTTVDTALSSTSTNPVQNKVINTALNGKALSNHNHDGTYIKTGTGTVTSTNIADKTIMNGDIADNAAIAYSKLSGVAASTHSHSYLPLSGGTVTGGITYPQLRTATSGTDSLPYAGAITWDTNWMTTVKARKSMIGTVDTGNGWWNVLSIRHRNGTGDGNTWGMILKAPLTTSVSEANANLIWQRDLNGNASTEKTIIDTNNMVQHKVVNNVLSHATNNQSTAGYFKILTIAISGNYIDSPIQFTINRRLTPTTNVQFYVQYYQKDTSSTSKPRYYKLNKCYYDGQALGIYVKQTVDNAGAGTFDIYTDAEAWSDLSVTPIITNNERNTPNNVTITPKNDFVTSLPSGCTQATRNPNYVAGDDSRLTNARTPTSHSHGSIANGGTLNSDITSVNKVVVTDSSNNIKTISKLPASAVTHQDISGKADKSSYVACTITYTNGTTGTINFVTR